MKMCRDLLRAVLDYIPETGDFVWKVAPGKNFSRLIGQKAGSFDIEGYWRISIGNKSYKAHRLAFLWMTGEVPVEVDHIDRNRSNNKWVNLRGAERKDNAKNLSKLSTNTSGMPGIDWSKADKKWRVRVMRNGVRYNGGLFSDFGKAVEKRNQMVMKLHEEFGAFH